MMAHWACSPYELLQLVLRRIVNETPGIVPVVYDISDKPSATIEWGEPGARVFLSVPLRHRAACGHRQANKAA